MCYGMRRLKDRRRQHKSGFFHIFDLDYTFRFWVVKRGGQFYEAEIRARTNGDSQSNVFLETKGWHSFLSFSCDYYCECFCSTLDNFVLSGSTPFFRFSTWKTLWKRVAFGFSINAIWILFYGWDKVRVVLFVRNPIYIPLHVGYECEQGCAKQSKAREIEDHLNLLMHKYCLLVGTHFWVSVNESGFGSRSRWAFFLPAWQKNVKPPSW